MKHPVLTRLAAALLLASALSACSTLPDIPRPALPMPDTRGLPLIGADVAPVTVTDSFVAAEARMRAAIGARGLRLFTVVDHGAGALSVGRDIGQSKLFLFGDPRGGTPLLEAEPELGLALPLRMLIYTDQGGRTRVLMTDIRAVGAAHRLDENDPRLAAIADLLRDMAREVAG